MSQGVAVGTPPGTTPAVHGVRRPSLLQVGVVVWLASELMFFAGLFAAWFTLRAENEVWPPAGVELEPARTGVFTVVLLLSSVTMHLAVRGAERDDRPAAIRWTLFTVLLGSVFLLNQALEYAAFDFGPRSHAYGSIFFLLTGFHGAHVLGGLVLMLAVLAVGASRSSRAPLGEGMTAAEYYWHFVDVVWVGMFTTIYVLS